MHTSEIYVSLFDYCPEGKIPLHYHQSKMSELMKNVYYNPSDPGSLGGKERLKKGVLQEYGVALKDKDVTDWLAAQDAYTLHRTAPVKYKRNRVVVYGKDVQFQADLVDMSAHSKENDNIKFLLTCIDVFSKYAWARPLKNKTEKRKRGHESIRFHTQRKPSATKITD